MLKRYAAIIGVLSFAAVPAAAAEQSPPLASTSGMRAQAGLVLVMYTQPQDAQQMWAGTARGGLWHSADGGNGWQHAAMGNLPVTAIAAEPYHPEVMYAGSGDGRSSGPAARGQGVFKSMDGGASWQQLPLTDPATVGENWDHVHSITVNTAGVVLAATSDNQRNGFVYRSVDGGKTWGLFPVYDGRKVGAHNLVHKVRFDPDNPDAAIFMDDYANVTHSADGGVSWNVVRKSSTSCK